VSSHSSAGALIDHFTVSCLVAWPLNESEAGGDLVNRSNQRKTSQSRVDNQQTQHTYDAKSGNQTNIGQRQHWSEASALTNTPVRSVKYHVRYIQQ